MPAARGSDVGKTSDEFRAWLRGLRQAAGLSQEELAMAVGTDRRNIGRWEVQGHEPGGVALLRVLSALGVELHPSPAGVPGAVSAELRELQTRLNAATDEAASRHDELLRRMTEQEEQLRVLTARLEEMRSPRE